MGENKVYTMMDRDTKALARKADKDKEILDFLGSNLTYLLRLDQVANNHESPLVWEELARVPKRQHLTTL